MQLQADSDPVNPMVRLARRMHRDALIREAQARRQPPLETPEGMVWISGRRLRWGDRTYLIRPFFLDRTPVTNADWRDWIRGTGELAPAHWIRREPPPGTLDHPVVGVNHAAAERYARWLGRRLPTHLEWLSAARGPEGLWPLPWGKGCSPETCHCPRLGLRGTAPVTAHPKGASPEGCLDLIGNVWEWTATDPRAGDLDEDRAYSLGGSFRGACGATPGTPHAILPRMKDFLHVGFRCARDVEPLQ